MGAYVSGRKNTLIIVHGPANINRTQYTHLHDTPLPTILYHSLVTRCSALYGVVDSQSTDYGRHCRSQEDCGGEQGCCKSTVVGGKYVSDDTGAVYHRGDGKETREKSCDENRLDIGP